MTWNLSAECISGIIVTIILVYAHRGNTVPTLKNRVFQLCLLSTFCSIVFNIASTLMLAYFDTIPLALTFLVTTIYFVFTPMMGMTYFAYTTATSCEGAPWLRPVLLGMTAPFVVYLLVVLTNGWMAALFLLDPQRGYIRGSWIWLTYAIFYLYCVACIVLILLRWKKADRSIRKILLFFPAIALVVVLVQARFPTYILSGSAATCALLIIYLYLQNKRIGMDTLTGLMSRQEFLNMLELREKRREPFAVIILSVNNFKLINDKFGVVKGDLFLRGISTFLKETAKGDWLYRYGGDQFVVQVEHNRIQRVSALADTLAKRMCSPWSVGDYNYVLSAAIGIVEFPDVASGMEEIISGIEATVAFAKRTRQQQPCRLTRDMLAGVARKKAITELLRKNLEQDSFCVYYQPIWSVSQQEFRLAEALLRMNEDPQVGRIFPNEFIPLAEDTGMIIDITYQTLEKVCRFIRDMLEKGVPLNTVAINFSVVQFMQEDLAQRVSEIIERNQVPYNHVKIEITESVIITNTAVVRRFMEEMSAKGVRFGLDDFGTGHSNVATVLQMPFDTIKLDKSIVWLAMEDPQAADFLWHLTRAFKGMGRNVLAEGVETQEQSDYVEACGCDLIQGFLYARPVPPEQAERIARGSGPVPLSL